MITPAEIVSRFSSVTPPSEILNDPAPGLDLRPVSNGAFQQELRRTQLIDDAIILYEKTAGEPFTQALVQARATNRASSISASNPCAA